MQHYRIRVKGRVDPPWDECLGGLTLTMRNSGGTRVTELTGELVDQSALQGVLDTLFMLQLPLLLVECDPGQSE